MRNYIRIPLLICLLLNSLNLSVFAQRASVSLVKRPPYSLFDPAKYDFMKEEPLIMLPADEEPSPNPDENYYKYSRIYLEKAIGDIDGERNLKERDIEYMEILNPSLMLPIFGTTISITGRKTFGLSFNAKKYETDESGRVENRNVSGLELEQEMQIKLQGKISDRIFVDIDYDDQREDGQNISVSYRGKEGEIVQSADFGDIQMSLPDTEFLSYDKQVFGAKMHLRQSGANLFLIGSQTKGEGKSKRFKGDSVFETVNLRDTQYSRRKYYDLTFRADDPFASCPSVWSNCTAAIVAGSETVYLDEQTNQGYIEAMSAGDLTVSGSLYPLSGNAAFKLLTRGVDYVIDYNRNIISFTNNLRDTDVVAINYQNTSGQWLADNSANPGKFVIIKTTNDRPISTTSEIGYKLEIKRYYDIGHKQITRDNGQGNFILRLNGPDGAQVCPAQNPPEYCKFLVNYEKGIFEIAGRFIVNPNLYNPTPSSVKNRSFFAQFASTVKTYFLEPNIVVQSDVVQVNGATMSRNRDYYIDYASGFITFYNEEIIGASSVIDVSYDVASGGNNKGSTLLGGRLSYDFTDNISIGTSIINEGGSAPKRVPQVGDLTTNLTVMEADLKVKDAEVLEGVKISLSGSAAQSKKNENLFGYAMIENMEDTKTSVDASLIYRDWFIGSNPSGKANFFDALKWDSQDIPLLEINPQGAANADDMQNVLVINYDFTDGVNFDGRDEVSLTFPISPYGVDFTDKTLLEMSMLGEANGPFLNISFGSMNEKNDSPNPVPTPPNLYPTCGKYNISYAPKTEDMDCTGSLTTGEDIGWQFVNPDGSIRRYNPFVNNQFNKETQPNGRIDTQDLNDNGILDAGDSSSGGSFGFDGTSLFADYPAEMSGNQINYTGWKHFQQEVDFSSSERWSSIRHVRITLKKGGKDKGSIKIANLSVSGNTWQNLNAAVSTSTLSTYGVNNIDNPYYQPLFNDSGDGGEVFRKLYGSAAELMSENGQSNVREQALAIKYDLSAATVFGSGKQVLVQRNFSRMDFSQHKKFEFLLYNYKGSNPTDAAYFFLRISTDDNNYSEIMIPLDSASFAGQWRKYTLNMIDTNGDGVPERWENASSHPIKEVKNEGSLNFRRVGILTAGVRSDSVVSAASGEVWYNDTFLGDAKITEGNAYSAQAKIDVEEWLEISGKRRYMDDTFQTPLSVPSKQKNLQEDYSLKFKRINNLPITANYHKSNTVTLDALDYNNSNTVSALDQGEVDRKSGNIRAEYSDPAHPRLSLEYAFENTDYAALQRNDDKDSYSANVQYSPRDSAFKSISGGVSFTNSNVNYGDQRLIESAGAFYNTDESVYNYNLKFSLEPWEGFSLSPLYNLSSASEKRRQYEGSQFAEKRYSKYATQNAGISSAIRIARWLAPTASYNVNIRENNNLSRVSTPFKKPDGNYYEFGIGEIKSVNRSAEGNVNLVLNGRELFPKTRLMSALSVSGSYKMQDGDTWENVDDSYNSLDNIWLRNSLGINAPYTYRSLLTLRDTYSSTMRWTPFKDFNWDAQRLNPLKTISISNNISRSYQTSEEFSSAYKTESSTLPDVVFFIDDIEDFITSDNYYFSGTNLKLKYRLSNSDTIGRERREDTALGADFRTMLINYFDATLSYNEQTLRRTDLRYNAPLENYLRRDFSAQVLFVWKKLRFTPKINYIVDSRKQTDNVLVSDVTEIMPSLNVKADFNLPANFSLPFVSRQYLVTNRIVWNANLSYSKRRSFVITENRDIYDASTNLDYEISKNLRLTLSGAFQYFKHLYIISESYTAYNLGTMLTIQF